MLVLPRADAVQRERREPSQQLRHALVDLDQVVEEKVPRQVPVADDRVELVQEVLGLGDELHNLEKGRGGLEEPLSE